MASKNISLREEAYERLNALKREDESFSDVVLRLTENERWSGFGELADTNIQEGMEKARGETAEGMEESIERMGEQ